MPSITSKICLVTPVAGAGVGVGSASGAGAGVVALPSVTETASDSFESADSPALTSVAGGGGCCDAILVSSIIRDAAVGGNCWLELVPDNTGLVRDLELERVLFSALPVYVTCSYLWPISQGNQPCHVHYRRYRPSTFVCRVNHPFTVRDRARLDIRRLKDHLS